MGRKFLDRDLHFQFSRLQWTCTVDTEHFFHISPAQAQYKEKTSTVRPRDKRPQDARTLTMHVFEKGPKTFEIQVFARFCTFLHVFARFLANETLRCTFFDNTWDACFCTFLQVFAHCIYLRYTNTCYKALTFNSTFFFLEHCITYHWPYDTWFCAASGFQFPKKRASQGLTAFSYQSLLIGTFDGAVRCAPGDTKCPITYTSLRANCTLPRIFWQAKQC